MILKSHKGSPHPSIPSRRAQLRPQTKPPASAKEQSDQRRDLGQEHEQNHKNHKSIMNRRVVSEIVRPKAKLRSQSTRAKPQATQRKHMSAAASHHSGACQERTCLHRKFSSSARQRSHQLSAPVDTRN